MENVIVKLNAGCHFKKEQHIQVQFMAASCAVLGSVAKFSFAAFEWSVVVVFN